MPISRPKTGIPGAMKKIICPNCDGLGRDSMDEEDVSSDVKVCPDCNGIGYVTAKVVRKGEF